MRKTTKLNIFRSSKYIDPYPVHKLKRVDVPTTFVDASKVERTDEQESGFIQAAKGEWGPAFKKHFFNFVGKHPLSKVLLKQCTDLAATKKLDVAPEKAPFTDNPEQMARHIKETAYFLRGDLVGICELPKYAIYSHDATGKKIDLDHKYAIAILIDQDYKTSEQSTGNDWAANSMSFRSYSTMAFVAHNLAEYIKELGYPARAHYPRHYQVQVTPILLQAGLGEMSRIGDIVINPYLGGRFKAAVVTTDLPMTIDKPIDFGLQKFCAKCQQCTIYCPSHSISDGEKVIHNGYEKWPIDSKSCTKFRIGNKSGAGCGICIKVCPWNKPNTLFHRFVKWVMINLPVFQSFAIWADEILGYPRRVAETKWWLNLEKVDDTLIVPKKDGRR